MYCAAVLRVKLNVSAIFIFEEITSDLSVVNSHMFLFSFVLWKGEIRTWFSF
jgi:hypothetical protein